MKDVLLDSKQYNVMLVIKVNCCFPLFFMTKLKRKALEKYRSYRMKEDSMILCKWQFAEISAEFMDVQGVDLFHLILDIQNEMSASKVVTSIVDGEK